MGFVIFVIRVVAFITAFLAGSETASWMMGCGGNHGLLALALTVAWIGMTVVAILLRETQIRNLESGQ